MRHSSRAGDRITGNLALAFVFLMGLGGLIYLLGRLGIGPFGGPGLGAQPPPPPAPVAQVAPLRTSTPFAPGQVAPPRTPPAPGAEQGAAAGTPIPAAASPPATPVATAVPTPAGPRPSIAEASARYVQAWEARRYPDMYRMLSASAQATIVEAKFVERYQAIAAGATLVSLKATLPPVREPPATESRLSVRFDTQMQTARFGELREQYDLPLVYEDRAWKVDWTPDLIFKGLAPDRTVRVYEDDPVRGQIVDRKGVPLAMQQKVPTLGVVPGGIKDQARVVGELAQYLQVDPSVIQQKLAGAQPDWWVPLGVFRPEQRDELQKRFGQLDGVVLDEKSVRVYPQGATAAHIVGYVSTITAEDLKTLAAKGYDASDVVGRAGVEASQEAALAGQRGGRLIISDPNGDTVRVIAERSARPGANVQLTLDVDLQKKAEAILAEKVGSLVLMDPRDNSVIAMASFPRFDPNGFTFGFSSEEWKQLAEDPRQPFQARPTMSTYATGSIFKSITMAAGLERGGFAPNTPFVCNGTWSLPNSRIVFGDWQKGGHGRLDLSEGLVQSCDIVFYELGKKLYDTDPRILTDFAHQFGLGEATGIGAVPEAAGTVPGPEWKQKAMGEGFYPGDEVNFAIGQGYLDATPLQMANVYSTIANNGLLRSPLLVRKVGPPAGEAPKEFKATEKRRVPVSPQTFAVIRDALKRVASSPRGTANYAMNGYRIPVAAKTGSAENQYKQAHAWFAGFGPADNPEVVVIAMVEGGEMGGLVAAPLGRQVFEAVLGK